MGRGSLTFFFSDKSFHMRARSRVSSLSESSGRSSCSCRRFSSEKMNMADTGRLGFSEPPCRWTKKVWVLGVLAGSPTSPPTPSQLCPLRTLLPSCEGFLEAGLVACFLLMLNIFSSPRTRCCSSSGRLWSGDKRWHGAVRLVASLLPGGPKGLNPKARVCPMPHLQEHSPLGNGAVPPHSLSFSGKRGGVRVSLGADPLVLKAQSPSTRCAQPGQGLDSLYGP